MNKINKYYIYRKRIIIMEIYDEEGPIRTQREYTTKTWDAMQLAQEQEHERLIKERESDLELSAINRAQRHAQAAKLWGESPPPRNFNTSKNL